MMMILLVLLSLSTHFFTRTTIAPGGLRYLPASCTRVFRDQADGRSGVDTACLPAVCYPPCFPWHGRFGVRPHLPIARFFESETE
jgi:hypothetical protein